MSAVVLRSSRIHVRESTDPAVGVGRFSCARAHRFADAVSGDPGTRQEVGSGRFGCDIATCHAEDTIWFCLVSFADRLSLLATLR